MSGPKRSVSCDPVSVSGPGDVAPRWGWSSVRAVAATHADPLTRQAWVARRELLQKAVEELERVFGREVKDELRSLRRHVAALDKKLTP